MKNLNVLILAAGKGTRLKSKKAKALHRAGGATLVEHVVRSAEAVADRVWVVAGYQAASVRSVIPGAQFVEQREQLGTGHAVMAARELLADYTGDLLVMPVDVPLISAATLEAFVAFHRRAGFRASILTADVDDPRAYGRVVRRDGQEVDRIVEHRDASPEVQTIREVNFGIYLFNAPALFEAISRVGRDNSQKEYYLTDVIEILVRDGLKVGASRASRPEEIAGVNTRQELAAVERLVRMRTCERLMANGVTIIDPDTTQIDSTVAIGIDSVIYPSVQIEGSTVIGEDVTIRSFSRITDCRIGSDSTILDSSLLVESVVGQGASVGPFAHLRMGTVLEDEVRVGNFVEIKKSRLGRGTKSMHLTYLGDATVGKKVNVGAGTITCNYDGVSKNPTIIEDEVFIGSDTQFIAPAHVGRGAYVAAGSTITEDVPAGSLALSRCRQVVKKDWVKKWTREQLGSGKRVGGPRAEWLVPIFDRLRPCVESLDTSDSVKPCRSSWRA